MNHRRRNVNAQPEDSSENDILKIAQSKTRLNRLKRSPRPSQTQARAPDTARATARDTDFKTPIRLANSRYRSSVTDESPNYESECHQDIIWDSTSPTTPLRNGRSRKRTAHLKSVDISDIVSRIAPKSRRPEEAESSLLQWIGDNVISCTPEVREPKTKPKSTRQNVADDLLQLAKQFDFNMIQQEENHIEQTSQEAFDEDQDLFCDMDNPQVNNWSLGNSEAERDLNGEKTSGDDGTDDLALLQDMEDDLDLLFDGATQHAIGRLSGSSQDLPKGTQGTNLSAVKGSNTAVDAVIATSYNNWNIGLAGGVGGDLECGTAKLSSSRQASVNNDFEDDWCNDDLLEDSLVFEMTQNPELFSAPQHSSTQKQTNWDKVGGSLWNLNSNKSSNYHQNAEKDTNYSTMEVPNQRLRNTQTFQPNRQWNVSGSTKDLQQRHIPFFSKAILTVPSLNNLNTNQYQSNKSNTLAQTYKPTGMPAPSGTSGASSTWRAHPHTNISSASSISESSKLPMVHSNSQLYKDVKVTVEKNNQQTAEVEGLGDIADEDLDYIFASDDIWDDGADDDDLFCEACEEVEELRTDPDSFQGASITKPAVENKKIQKKTVFSSKETFPSATANKHHPQQENILSRPYSPKIPACSSSSKNCPAISTHTQVNTLNHSTVPAGNSAFNMESRTSYKGQYKFTQVNRTTGIGNVTSSDRAQQPVSMNRAANISQSSQRAPDDHQFKKPYSTFGPTPVISKDVGKAAGRCSDAEIERKKQQAMERRRLRMLASQNLRAPI